MTRVTGGNASNILATLGVLGPANLFLINPNGIIFGPNAHLDMGGSFVASTANSLVFDNGLEFSATNPLSPPLLTVNIPVGLRLRENSASIVNQSSAVLYLPQTNTLALVGGNVILIPVPKKVQVMQARSALLPLTRYSLMESLLKAIIALLH